MLSKALKWQFLAGLSVLGFNIVSIDTAKAAILSLEVVNNSLLEAEFLVFLNDTFTPDDSNFNSGDWFYSVKEQKQDTPVLACDQMIPVLGGYQCLSIFAQHRKAPHLGEPEIGPNLGTIFIDRWVEDSNGGSKKHGHDYDKGMGIYQKLESWKAQEFIETKNNEKFFNISGKSFKVPEQTTWVLKSKLVHVPESGNILGLVMLGGTALGSVIRKRNSVIQQIAGK